MRGSITYVDQNGATHKLPFDGSLVKLAQELRRLKKEHGLEPVFKTSCGFRAVLALTDRTRLSWYLSERAGGKMGLEGIMGRHLGLTVPLLEPETTAESEPRFKTTISYRSD